jgi:tRNA(Ile2) C34 agmatinyltransferase TiaS
MTIQDDLIGFMTERLYKFANQYCSNGTVSLNFIKDDTLVHIEIVDEMDEEVKEAFEEMFDTVPETHYKCMRCGGTMSFDKSFGNYLCESCGERFG